MTVQTFDLYQAAFYTFLGGKVVESYGIKNNHKVVIKTNRLVVALERVFRWLWVGLRDARIAIKYNAYEKDAKLELTKVKLGFTKQSKATTKLVRREQSFLKNIDKIKSREMTRIDKTL